MRVQGGGCGGGGGGGSEGGRGYIQEEYEPIIMTYTAVRDPADEADERQVACVRVALRADLSVACPSGACNPYVDFVPATTRPETPLG